MKWISQHIWDFISRFRNDVYIEALEEQDQEFSVMVGSNGKLTKSNYPIERARIRVRNDEGSTIPLGSALYCKGYEDDRILVGLCDNTDASKMPCIGIAIAEMNTTTTKDNYGVTQGLLTTTIPVTGAILVNLPLFVGDDGFLIKEAPKSSGSLVQSVGVVVKTDATSSDCEVLSVSITNQVRDRDASGIKGLQDTNTDIKSEADLKFYIDSDDGAGTNKFYWYDHTNSIMELDNNGNLQLDGGITTGSTSFVDSSGVVQVATQGTIDHDSLANFALEEHYRWDNDIQSTATINHANLSSDTGSEGEVLVINNSDAVWGHPEKIHLQVRNDEGSTIPAGAPLYSKGEIGASNRILVGICDADDPAKMPCIGLAEVAMNTTSTKDNFAITQGIYNTNISGFTGLSDGDILYVDTSGSLPYLTKTKPTGESSLIQNVGIVLKTNGTICQALQVSAIGRTNDVPNLNSGYIFYGNGSNKAVSTQLSTLLPPDLTVNGAGTINANNVPTLNQDTTGNAATATSATSAGTATNANTAKGLLGGTNQDVIIESEGNVEVRIDNNKKFKIDDDSGTEIFSVREAGLVEMTSAIISSSGLLQVEGGIIRNSTTTSNFAISSSRILNLVHGNNYDIQLGDATNARVLTVRGATKEVIIDGTLDLGLAGDTTISRLSAGRVTIEGNEIQTTNKNKHFINFGVNLGYSHLRWIPWGSYYIFERNTDGDSEFTTYVAPYDGKFIKLIIRSQVALGDTVISMYKAGDGTDQPDQGSLIDTKTVDVSSAHTSYTYIFDSDATFSKGDAMSCSIDPAGSGSISGSPGVTGTFVMEFDLST